jgi:hypothetical protein
VIVSEGSPEWWDGYFRGLDKVIKGRYVPNFSYLWPAGKPRDRNFSSDGTDFVLVNNDFTGEFVARKIFTNTVLLSCVSRELYYKDLTSRETQGGTLVVSYVTRKSSTGTWCAKRWRGPSRTSSGPR